MSTPAPDASGPAAGPIGEAPARCWTRRGFLRWSAGTTVGAAAGALGYAWGIEPHWVEVVRRDLPVAHLPGALEGCTLVQLSDLHVGPVVDSAYLTAALERVSRLQPDLVVLTGDLMTCKGTEQVEATAEVLGHLRPGRLATLAVLGNHDYGADLGADRVADRLTEVLTRQGIEVLRNARRNVAGLHVVGLDDLWSRRFQPGPVLASLPAGQPALVLCHNPDGVDRPGWGDYRGWVLSGHTHGGQCKFPYLDPPILPVENHRYVAGEVDLHDGRRLYINRGLGYLERVRFNARPEVTVFTLRREDSA